MPIPTVENELDGGTLNPGDNPWAPIEELGNVTVFDRTKTAEVVKRLKTAAVAVTNKVQLPDDVLQRVPELQLVAVTATGYDVVDTEAAHRLGIVVSNVPAYGTDSVAQFAFANILELCHRVSLHDTAVRDGQWDSCRAFSFWNTPQVELAGQTLGIIGFGRIGRRTGEIGHAFGMRVLACDEHQNDPPSYQPFAWASSAEIAETADVVVLHCNLTPHSKGIISRDFLSRMKPTAFFINPARGGLVDEAALANSLNRDLIAGAAVDVVSSEPIKQENPLLSAKNCIITPHMAWTTLAARKRLMQATAENIRCFLAGTPVNVVN